MQRRSLQLCLFVLVSFVLAPLEAAAQTEVVGPNAWRRPYAVMRAKLDAGETVRIGVMGGSISRGATTFPRAGTSPDGVDFDYSETGPAPYNPETQSLRGVFRDRLQAEFGQHPGQIEVHNLALGGSDTYEGTFRYAKNAVPLDLDMLVIEFAVNDMWHAPGTLTDMTADFSLVRMLECLVVQAFDANPNLAILFSISTARSYYENFDSPDTNYFMHRLEVSRHLHRSYATSRGIPYVDMTDVFYNGTVPSYVRLYEGPPHAHNRVHMSPTGHRVYGEALARVTARRLHQEYFEFGQPMYDVPGGLQPFPLNPRLVTPNQLTLTPSFEVTENGEPSFAIPIFTDMESAVALEPRVMLNVPFEGTSIGLWWQGYFGQEKSVGRIGLWLDGQFLGTHARGQYTLPGDQGWPRMQHIGFGLDPDVPHLLRIGILADQPEEMRIGLLGVLVGE